MALRVSLQHRGNEYYFSKGSHDRISIRATLSSFDRPCITIECAGRVDIDIDSETHLDMLFEALMQHERYDHLLKPEWAEVVHAEYRRRNATQAQQGSEGPVLAQVPAENCAGPEEVHS